jgi:hypothetical protein
MGMIDNTVYDKKLWQSGREYERMAIAKMLREYFEITQSEELDPNPEWDAGFQAAIAIIENDYNHNTER